MDYKQKIEELVNNFDGNISLYALDDNKNEIRINENQIVETASCIKTFILVEYYNQIINGKKSRNDILIYNKNDYVTNGSGILQFLESNIELTSKNMAILMIILSDNIATNKMIEYLGFDNINQTIKKLGFNNTELSIDKLDFSLYNSIGKTTAYEYAKIYQLLLNKEILTPELCDEIIEILSNQTLNTMLVKKLPIRDLDEKGTEKAFIKYIASKSGSLGDIENKNMVNCRNDGGIISTKLGNYIISIFINNFSDYYFYDNNSAIVIGAEINKIIFENFKNKGNL